MIAQFKATTTRWINELRGTPGQKVWQRNYNDRIIRNEVELDKLRQYIQNNPRQSQTTPAPLCPGKRVTIQLGV